eukprot:Platyproteum_vivax@DN7962_c0_g1_i1.p1
MQALVQVRLLVQAAPKRMLYPSYRCFAYKATQKMVDTEIGYAEDTTDEDKHKFEKRIHMLPPRLPPGFRVHPHILEKNQVRKGVSLNPDQRERKIAREIKARRHMNGTNGVY